MQAASSRLFYTLRSVQKTHLLCCVFHSHGSVRRSFIHSIVRLFHWIICKIYCGRANIFFVNDDNENMLCYLRYDTQPTNQPHRQLSLLRPAEQYSDITILPTRKFRSFGEWKVWYWEDVHMEVKGWSLMRGEEREGCFWIISILWFWFLILHNRSVTQSFKACGCIKLIVHIRFLSILLDIFQLNRPRKQHSTVMTTNFHSLAFFNPQICTNCIHDVVE